MADAGERRRLRRCGIVSGCLSFPSDATQGELLDLYQGTLERTLGEEYLGTGGAWPPTRSGGVAREGADRTAHTNPANYVAQELGLGSEHYCIDAACASALYVLKLAQDALLSGKADIMLASGSCLPRAVLHPDGLLGLPGAARCPAAPPYRCRPARQG